MLISPDEINKSLSKQNWIYSEKKISKSYSFNKYMDGIEFINKVATLAETKNHHPDIVIGWCKVNISITSHEMGGVSTKCVNLALDIDLILE